MASKITGYQSVVFVEDGYDFDATGSTYFEVWRGSRAGILYKAAELQAAGYRVTRRKFSGPLYQVTGTLSLAPESGGGSGSETPVDRYRITTQLAQLDLRSNPALITLCGSERVLAQYVKEIDNDIADVTIDANYDSYSTEKQTVADLRLRGAQAYELKRPVLTRIRTMSVNYSSEFVMEAQPKVYTTTTLISTFGIPLAVQAKLPVAPATSPTRTTWAWLWQQQDSDVIPTLGRVEEMDSWVFAAWSNAMYEVV